MLFYFSGGQRAFSTTSLGNWLFDFRGIQCHYETNEVHTSSPTLHRRIWMMFFLPYIYIYNFIYPAQVPLPCSNLFLHGCRNPLYLGVGVILVACLVVTPLLCWFATRDLWWVLWVSVTFCFNYCLTLPTPSLLSTIHINTGTPCIACFSPPLLVILTLLVSPRALRWV